MDEPIRKINSIPVLMPLGMGLLWGVIYYIVGVLPIPVMLFFLASALESSTINEGVGVMLFLLSGFISFIIYGLHIVLFFVLFRKRQLPVLAGRYLESTKWVMVGYFIVSILVPFILSTINKMNNKPLY